MYVPELEHKRSAEVVRRPDQTLVMPKPVGSHLIRRRTKKATLRELHRLSRRGYVASASALAQFHSRAGGGYGVKIALAKPLPEPMPGWAKGCALVGATLAVLSILAVFVLNALTAAFTAAAAIPWGFVFGGLVVVVIALLLVKRFVFGGISISQNVNIR